MKEKEDQRVCIEFCVKLGKTFTETFHMLQIAFDDECLSRLMCHEWFKRFKEDRKSTADDPRSGRPTVSTDDDHVAQVNDFVHSNCRLTIREMAEECNISFGSWQEILTEKLHMHRVAAAPRQRPFAIFAPHSQFLHEKCDDSCSPASLLTRSGPSKLLFVPKNEKTHERRKV